MKDCVIDRPPPATGRRRLWRRGPIKVTLFLLVLVFDRLEGWCGRTGESRTDAINRAIQLYLLYNRTVENGGTFLVQDSDGRRAEIHIR